MNKPFLLKPAGKDYLWGGQRLNDNFSKEIDLDPLAETWECSTHPDGPSVVNSGEFQEIKLGDVLKEHPEFLGTHPQEIIKEGLPVLIKIIDAKTDLSVQVHPSDEYAFTHEKDSSANRRCGMSLTQIRDQSWFMDLKGRLHEGRSETV